MFNLIYVNQKLSFLVFILLLPFGNISAQVDYYTEIQPLFDEYCTSCHGGISGIELSTYESTLESTGELYQEKMVIPGAPEESPLVDKVEANPQFGDRMPLNRQPLNREQIDLIRQWIEEGAVKTAPDRDGLIVDRTDHFKLVQNFPNPFDRQTTIRIRSDRAGEYLLEIYDLQGRILEKRQGNYNIGATHIRVEMQKYSSGIYLYRAVLAASGLEPETLSGQMILVR